MGNTIEWEFLGITMMRKTVNCIGNLNKSSLKITKRLIL